MASVQTSKYDGRYLKLTVEETATSIENNTSTLTWTLESIGGNSTYYNIYDAKVTINDIVEYGPTTKSWDSKVFPAKKGSVSGTVTITHNADGTASDVPFVLRGSVYNNNPKNYSGTLPLSTIPRASQITVNDANIGSSTNIVINKASDSFTTTLRYKAFDENNWTTIVEKTANQVYGWTVPTSFYSKIPNSQTMTCEFQAETFSGDTSVGTSTYTATFTATGNPVINSASATDINSTTATLTGDSSKMIRYASNVQISINASGQNSASISSIYVNGNSVSGGSITFNSANTNTFNIVVIDSRGYQTGQTITMTMVDYVPLTINASITRHTPTDGKVDINVSGNYFNNSFGSQSNSLTIQYRYKESTSGTWGNWTNLSATASGNLYSASTQLSDMDYTKSYNFEVQAIDKIQTKQIVGITVTRGIPVFNWDNDEFDINTKLYTSSSGREDYAEDGFTYDEAGNMQHKRSNSGDSFQIKANNGNPCLQILPETGAVNVGGDVGLGGNLAITGHLVNKTMSSTNLNDIYENGTYSYDNGSNTYSNAPTTDGIHILNVLNNGTVEWVVQEDYVLRYSSTTVDKYIRLRTPTGWGNWQKII